MSTVKERLAQYTQEETQNNEIEKVKKKIQDKKAELGALIDIKIRSCKEMLKDYSTCLKKVEEQYKKETRFFVRLKKSGNNTPIKHLKREIERYKKLIEEETKKLEQSELEIGKLKEEISVLESSIASKKLSRSIFGIDETGKLIIDVSKKVPEDIEQNDEKMMVHVTSFFPKNHTIVNNYNGNKIVEVAINYQGVGIKVKSLVHRHTVHFTQNNVVHSTGDGAGSWGNEKYIILEPLKNHINDNICGICIGDSWIYGDIHFGSDSILLVRKEAYDELSAEIKTSYNIVLFEGNAQLNVEAILSQFGYPIFNTSAARDYPGHSLSPEGLSEMILNNKNEAINYMTDNKWDGKSKIILSEEELVDLFRILTTGVLSGNFLFNAYKKVIEQYDPAILEYEKNNNIKVNREVLRFILGTGLYKNSDGNYSFKTDAEIYDMICKLKKTKDYNIDFKFYEEIMKILEKHIRAESPLVPLDNNIPLSNLTSFKYHNMARSFVNELNAILNKYNLISKGGIALSDSYDIVLDYIDKDGIVLKINIGDNLYDFIDGNYEIHNVEHDDSNNCLNYIIKLNGNTAEEVLKQAWDFIEVAHSYFNQSVQIEEKKDSEIDMDMKLYDLSKPENSEMNDALRTKIKNITNKYQIKIKGYPEKSYDVEMHKVSYGDIYLFVKVGTEAYDFIKDNYRIYNSIFHNLEYNELVDPYRTYEIVIDAKTVGEGLDKIEELARITSNYIAEKNKTITGKRK